MIKLHNLLKSFERIVFGKTANPFNLLNNKNIRLFATETAVQKIQIRSYRKPKKLYDSLSWFLLVIPASAFGLGTWQVFRKLEKEKLIDEFMKKLDQPPIDLPKDLNELQNLEYRKVRVRGKFDHSKELYFGPRSKIDDSVDKLTLSLLSTPSAGYLIITPFKLSDRNLTILVNRGWVPPDKKSPHNRPEGQISEEVELVGLVRLHQNREPLGMKNMPEKNCWLYRDLHKMAEVAGTAEVFLDADKSSTLPGGPVGGQTLVGLPNDHLSYIYTWYGLSAASGYLWYLRHFPKTPVVV